MKQRKPTKRTGREKGAALLIAIFALLLISVIAIALVVSSGTDSALQNNYRTATGSYYAALAGLEEGRGRLLWKNPNYINNTNSYPALMNARGLPAWGLTQVLYIVNPASGETVDPTSASAANYPDTEYQAEFGWPLSGTVVTQIPSVSPVTTSSPSLPGQQYKWVRITAATEKSLGLDVDGDGAQDTTTVLYYDPAHVDAFNNSAPGLIAPATPPATAAQALEITSLAVLPGGSRRLLQYVVAPLMISPSTTGYSFPAALTLDGALDGTPATFQPPPGPPPPPPTPSPSNFYQISGVDACPTPIPQGAVPAIGTTNPTDYAAILTGLLPTPLNAQYSGAPMMPSGPPPATPVPTTPSVANLTTAPMQIRQAWQHPATLDALVQDITKNADIVINSSAAGADISSRAPTMSALNPLTIVINGDLNLAGWHSAGFGLLLVTGTLNYDPDASWNGLVLVIGQGVFSSINNGSSKINGAVFVAKTRDGSGNLLNTPASNPTLGAPFFGSLTGFGGTPGYGISYNSCAGQSPTGPSAQGPLSYKVLSFREVALAN